MTYTISGRLALNKAVNLGKAKTSPSGGASRGGRRSLRNLIASCLALLVSHNKGVV